MGGTYPMLSFVNDLTQAAPELPDPAAFNADVVLPYGLRVDQVRQSMDDFCDFLRVVNERLLEEGHPRLESIIMPASFSGMVGEFMHVGFEKHCPGLVKNQYHNGHPDVLPAGMFPGNAVQYAEEGIEIKGSRYDRGWQGHNEEGCWLMVFVFDSNRPADEAMKENKNGDLERRRGAVPFRFSLVCGARLERKDWVFSGRGEGSRRTITASVKTGGRDKMMANWIYRRRAEA